MKVGPIDFPAGGEILGIVIVVLAVAYVGRAILPASKFNGFNYSTT